METNNTSKPEKETPTHDEAGVASAAPCSGFLGYDEPIGTRITLSPNDTARVRLANHFFHGEMFRYFENLASGQTGWGISYNGWLRMRGWKLIGYMTYERVQGMEDDSPND